MDNNRLSNKKDFLYEGLDLEAMGNAKNYHNWILDKFEPYIGKKILEVGAGTGTITKLLRQRFPNSEIIALEPSDKMYPILEENIKCESVIIKKNFTYEVKSFLEKESIDTIIYINVLEHIEKDLEEMSLAYDILIKGGYILGFSPALPFLFSEFDKSVGHFRRYSLKEWTNKIKKSGFKVIKSYYFDIIGILPWFITIKLMKKLLNPNATKMYDKLIVPWVKYLEPNSLLPFGKNVLGIGKKRE